MEQAIREVEVSIWEMEPVSLSDYPFAKKILYNQLLLLRYELSTIKRGKIWQCHSSTNA